MLTRIQTGEQAALTALYDATAARVYALALRILRDSGAAEETVSDVYFQVWRAADRYAPERGAVLAWLQTLCRSRALDALRRREPAELCADPTASQPYPETVPHGPEELLDAYQRGSALHAALAGFALRERELLHAAFFRGESHSEIASRTGLPLGTVKSLLRRSMLALKQALESSSPTSEKLS